MKEYQDEGAPLIIVGNVSYSANLNTTLETILRTV